MRAIIIDDEKNAIDALKVAINEYCTDIEVIASAQSASDGIKKIEATNPDIVFTDIEMPGLSGIEMIETFKERTFEVVFVTAYNKYALKAFKLNAIDYILKPINVVELINSIKKITDRTQKKYISNSQIDKLKLALSGKLAIPTNKGTEFLNIDNIVHYEADGSYVKIFTVDNTIRCVSKNLKYFETILEDESFFRCHKSYLINLAHIKKYNPIKDGGFIELTNNHIIPVSRNVKENLSNILKEHTL